MSVAPYYGQNAETVFNNFDTYQSRFLGEGYSFAKGTFQSIWDSGMAMATRMQMGRLASEINGWEVGGLVQNQPVTSERMAAARQELSTLYDRFRQYSTDVTPRSWITEAAKTIAGIVPYTVEAVGTGLAVNAAAGIIGMATGLAIPAGIVMALTTGVNFARSSQVMSGISYLDMVENGIDESVARRWAPVSGILQSAVESVLGAESFAAGGLGNTITNRVSSNILKKMFTLGTLSSPAAKALSRLAVSAASEGFEEGTQALIEGLTMLAAQAMVEEGTITDPLTGREVARNIADSVVTALWTAPFIGLAGHVREYASDARALRNLAAAAPSFSREDFQTTAVNSKILNGPGMDEAAQRDAAGIMWDHQQTLQLEAATQAAAETSKKAEAGIRPEGVQVDESGNLYTRIDVDASRDGGNIQDVVLTAGDPADSTTYGTIEATVDYQARTLQITGGDIKADYVGSTRDMIDSLSQQYPGFRIGKASNLTDAALIGGLQGFTANKTEVPYEGLEPVEATAKSSFESYLRQQGVAEEFASPVADLAEAFSKIVGVSFDDYTSGLGFAIGESDFTKLATGGKKLKTKTKTTAAFYTDQRNMGIVRDQAVKAGQDYSSSDTFGKEAERVIISIADRSLGDAQELDSFVHEMAHDFRAMASKHIGKSEKWVRFESVYGVTNGQWSKAQDEMFRRDFQEYLRGKTDMEPEKLDIFQQIARFIRRVVGAFSDRLKPDVRAAFDEMFGGVNLKPSASIDITGEINDFYDLSAYKRNPAYKGLKNVTDAMVRRSVDVAAKHGISAVQFMDNYNKYKAQASLYSLTEGMPSPKVKALNSPAFAADPQLLAEIALFAGEKLTQDQQDLLTMAQQQSGQGVLFSLVEDGSKPDPKGVAESDLLFEQSVLFSLKGFSDRMGRSASEFKTFEDFLAYAVDDPELLSSSEREFLRARYDFATAVDKGEIKKRFAKPGSFADYLAMGDNFSNLIYRISSLLNSRNKDADSLLRAERIDGAIAQTPQIKNLVDRMGKTGERPSLNAKKEALKLIRKHEALYEYLMAMAYNDQELANEALDNLNTMPELMRRELTGSTSRSIREQEQILDALQGEALHDKIKDGTATLDEVEEYIKQQEKAFESEREAYEQEIKDNETWRKKREKERATWAEQDAAKAEREIKKEQARAERTSKKFAEYKERIKRINAARKLAKEMKRLTSGIMRRPSVRIDLGHSAVIRLIQDMITEGIPSSLEEAEKMFAASSYAFMRGPDGRLEIAGMSVEAIYEGMRGLANLNEGAWSLESVRALYGIISGLSRDGRTKLRNRESEWGLKVKNKRSMIVNELRNSKNYKTSLTTGSEERRERDAKNRIKEALYDVDRPDAWFRKFLGKTATKLLFDDLVQNDRIKNENYDRRVNPVNDFIAEHKMANKKGLWRSIVIKGIGENDSDFTITGGELLGLRMLLGTESEFNQYQREAFIYGNLFSADEKDVDGTRGSRAGDDTALAAGRNDGAERRKRNVNDYMREKYNVKLEALLKLLKDNMSENDEQLAQLMMKAVDNDTDWYRFAHAIYEMSNKEPKRERFYFPIFRIMGFTQDEDAILGELKKDSSMYTALDIGMSLERRHIDPNQHKPIKIDATEVVYDAVSKQEHVSSMGPYIKELYGVFQNPTLAEGLRSDIRNSLGQKGLDYVKAQIDTITNPNAMKEKSNGSDAMTFLRGSMVLGNLAWRLSSVAMQLMTSPLPTLADAPFDMFKVAMESMLDPIGFHKKIEQNSAMLRHRQMMPEQENIQRRVQRGIANKIERVAEFGMRGLIWADRRSVAISWEAVRRAEYRRRYNKLTAAERAMDGKLNTAQAEAMEYADRFIIQTQPTAEEQYRAPMYRDPDSFKQLILQFTQPLNVIYNNIRHDIPEAARQGEYRKIVGFLSAYVLSGLAVGLIGVMRGRGPDDPDEEKMLKYWLHAATAQFTDSIPFVGQVVTGLTGYAIIGDNNSWLRMDNNMPAIDLLARAAEGVIQADPGKVAKNAAMGLGLLNGVPVRAIMGFVESMQRITGEGED